MDPSFVEEFRGILEQLKSTNFSTTLPLEIEELFLQYQSFCQQTINSDHGPTAKYWVTYIQLIELYHQFVRAIRTGDYKLLMYLQPDIASLFFVFNHQNYTRWLIRYHDNLLNM